MPLDWIRFQPGAFRFANYAQISSRQATRNTISDEAKKGKTTFVPILCGFALFLFDISAEPGYLMK